MQPRTKHDTPERTRWRGAIRRLLLVPISPEGARIVDILILPIGAVVAFFVCIPLWILTIAAGAIAGSTLVALGAPDWVGAICSFVGIGGGLALSFVVLLQIYRRVPAGIRSWVTPDDAVADGRTMDDPEASDADSPSLEDRIGAADARLAGK